MQDSKRDTDVLNRLLDSVGEGEGGMIWENDIETCKKQNKTKLQPHKTGTTLYFQIYMENF